MKHTATSKTETSHTLDISAEDLRRMLKRERIDLPAEVAFEWLGDETTGPMIRIQYNRSEVSVAGPRELEVRS